MSENTETTNPVEPPRLSANYNPQIIQIPIYLMFFRRSPEEIEYQFKTWISEHEFENLADEFAPLADNKLLKEIEFSGFTNPDNPSGQAVAALDAKIRLWFKMKTSDKLVSYRINGITKVIVCKYTDADGGIKTEREITNTAANQNGQTFDKLTAADSASEGDHLLQKVGQACFFYSAKSDETSFLGRVFKVLTGE